MATLKELRNERIKKLEKLKEMGFNPYPPHSQKDVSNQEVVDNYEKYQSKTLNLTGRIHSLRSHSQLYFIDIYDFSGKIQLYIKEDEIEPTNGQKQILGFNDLDLLDIGDFVQAEGEVTKSQSGEISLLVKNLTLLTKAIRPLPDKREGLKDQEIIFRRRYLDLAINPESRELFVRKSKFWEVSRNFLKERGFLEVETPVLEHVTGGADAKPFITHHEALDENFYLRISTELYLKRLIGGGFEKIYTFGPNFRNEGLSDEHLQEYYQIEWYWAYADYRDNMNLVKEMFRHIAKKVYGKTKFTKGDYTFDFSNKWEEISYPKIIQEKFSVDVFETPDEKILKILKDHHVSLPGLVNRNRLVDNLWKLIRQEISGPAFLIDLPKFISPLSKSKPQDPRLTERFQPIIAGTELGNGYTELNDPFDQLARFKDQQAAREAGDEEAQMLDIDFVEMLEYGMPPTSGYGQSERIFWFLEDVTAREGTLFPQMRRKIDEVTAEIYNLKATGEGENQSSSEPKLDKENLQETSDLVPKKVQFNKEEAQKLLDSLVKEEYQKLHALMVAKGMEAYAKKFGEDENLWYITGLIHDLDYDKFPDEHPKIELEWYKSWGFPDEFIHAVAAHAHQRTGIDPQTKIANALMAIDEMAGLLYAYFLMRPEGFEGMEPKSVKKKFKDKAFARKIDRDEIKQGMEGLGVQLSDHSELLINVYKDMPELKKD